MIEFTVCVNDTEYHNVYIPESVITPCSNQKIHDGCCDWCPGYVERQCCRGDKEEANKTKEHIVNVSKSSYNSLWKRYEINNSDADLHSGFTEED